MLLYNDLIGCNYCDTSSPHNAMHSSSQFSKTASSIGMHATVETVGVNMEKVMINNLWKPGKRQPSAGTRLV